MGRQVVLLDQGGDLGLLSLSDDLPVRANHGADGGSGENRVLLRLPAQQAGDGGKRYLLGQQTGLGDADPA